MKIESIKTIEDVESKSRAHSSEVLEIYQKLKAGQCAEISLGAASRHGIQLAIRHLTEKGLIQRAKLRTLFREEKRRFYLYRYE